MCRIQKFESIVTQATVGLFRIVSINIVLKSMYFNFYSYKYMILIASVMPFEKSNVNFNKMKSLTF